MLFDCFQALATVEEQKLQMEKMEKMVKMLQKERDQALSMLTRHGLKIDHHIEVELLSALALLRFLLFDKEFCQFCRFNIKCLL